MATITFDVPESPLSALRLSPNEFAREIRVAAALLWYSHGEISQSIAAGIAGTSRAVFIDQFSRRRIPVVQTTADETTKFVASDGFSTFELLAMARSAWRRATDRANLAACRAIRRLDSNALTYLVNAIGVEGYDPARDTSGLADERIAMSRMFMYGDCRLWVPPVLRSETADIPPGELAGPRIG